MLEKQISVILAKYLNKFICDLQEEQLRVSLWSGDLVLRNLELRANILDQIFLSLSEGRRRGGGGGDGDGGRAEEMDPSKAAAEALLMPFTVVSGVVRELVISVPWSALDREPVSVEARGVEIVLGPLRRLPYNAEEDALRVQMVKQKQLRMFEAERRGGKVSGKRDGVELENALPEISSVEGNSKNRSYLEQVIETIVRNVHVVLYDVSLRYVLDYDGLHPRFTSELVVSLKEVFVTTTDDDAEDRFVMDLSMPYCKKVVITDLDICVRALKHQRQQQQQQQQEQKDLLKPAEQKPAQEWEKTMTLVNIPDLTLCLRFPGANNARFALHVLAAGPVRICASFGAAGALALIADSLRYGLLGVHYRQHLHLLYTSEGNMARRRWSFAICCTVENVRRACSKVCGVRRCFVDDVVRFGERRRTYCALWKRAQGVFWLPALTAAERATLDSLEEALTLEQIILFRCLAYDALGAERLLHMQQKEYISVAMRRFAAAKAQGDWWWRRWFAPSETASSATDSVAECDENSFSAEWERAERFLQHIACGRSVGGRAVSVAVHLVAAHVIIEFYPAVWHREVVHSHPLLSFVESLEQHIEVEATSLHVTYSSEPTPRDNFVGLDVHIGTASAAFCGEVAVPLLESLHDTVNDNDEVDGVSTQNLGNPWFALNANETRTMFSLSLGRTLFTLHPLCELCWWGAAVQDFFHALPRYTARLQDKTYSKTNLDSNTKMDIVTVLPSFNINVAGIDLVVPLSTPSSQLLLQVPSLCFTKAESGAALCRFSLLGDAPVRLCCSVPSAENMRIFEIGDVEVNIAPGNDVTVHLHVELTVDQRALAAINAYILSLYMGKNSRARLMYLFEQAQADQLAQSAGAVSASSPGLGQNMRVALRANFACVSVRNANGDDIVDIQLRGNDDDSSAPALFFEATRAATGESSFLLRVPDLMVASHSGRHVFALEHLSVSARPSEFTAAAASALIVLCHPLVECAEVFLGAAASLRLQRTEATAKRKTKTALDNAETEKTERLTRVSIGRVDLHLTGCDKAMVTAHVSRATLCIDDCRRTTNAHFTLEMLKHVTVDEDTDDNAECFTLLGPNMTSEDACMTVRVEMEPTSLGTHVRSLVEGGQIRYFHRHWQELVTLYKSPLVERLLAIPKLDSTRRGFLFCEDEVMHRETENSRKASESVCEPGGAVPFFVDAEVRAVEMLLATDARRDIDVSTTDSYSRFSLDSIVAQAKVLMGSHWRADAKVRGVHYIGKHNDTSPPLIALADIRIENGVRLVANADHSGYDLCEQASLSDVAVLVNVRDSEVIDENVDKENPNKTNASSSPTVLEPAAALDVQLTTTALGILLCAFSFNIMSPTASSTPPPAASTSSATHSVSSGHSSMLLTLDSMRFLLLGEEHRDAFVLRGAAQGFAWHSGAAAGWNVHLRSVTLHDISASRSAVSRDVPLWKVAKLPMDRDPSAECRRCLVSLESAAVVSIDKCMECFFTRLNVTAASRSWAALLGALSSGAASTALAEMKERSANKRNDVKNSEGERHGDVSAPNVIVRMRDCRLIFEEMWEEPLATLSLPAVDVSLRDSGRAARLRITAPIMLEPYDGGPSIFQWTPLEKCRAVGKNKPSAVDIDEVLEDSRHANDDNDEEENGYIHFRDVPNEEDDEGIIGDEFVHIYYAAAPVVRMDAFDVPSALRPRFTLAGRLSVFVQGICLVVDVSFVRRFLAYAEAEVGVYTSFFAPRLPTPVTDVPALRVRVHDASLRLQYSDFGVFLETLNVVNAYNEAPKSATPAAVHCAAHSHTLRACGLRLLHKSLDEVVLPNFLLRVIMPNMNSVFEESRSALAADAGDRRKFSCTYTFTSHPPPPAAFCRRVRLQTDVHAQDVFFSLLHAREALRSYHAVASRAALHPLPAFYAVSPRVADGERTPRTSFSFCLPRVVLRVSELSPSRPGAVFAALRFRGRATAELAAARAHVAVCGGFELLDGRGTALLHRRAPAAGRGGGKEKEGARGRGDEDEDAAVEFGCVETREERRVFVESRGITVSLHPLAVDFVLRLHNVIALLVSEATFDSDGNDAGGYVKNESLKSGIMEYNSNNDTVGGGDKDALVETVAKRTLLSVHLSTFVVALEDKALLEVRGVEAKFERGPMGHQWGLVNEQLYSFRIAEIVLLGHKEQRTFVRIGGAELLLGVAQVNVRAKSVIVNNYNTLFFMDVIDSARALYEYVMQNIKLSKDKEEGFKQSIIVTLSDVCVCFFLSKPIGSGTADAAAAAATATTTRRSLSTGTSDKGAEPLSEEQAGVELMFPAIVVKQVASTTTRTLSFETEDGILCYRRPDGRLPPFVKNVSLMCLIMEDIVAQSTTTTFNLSSIEAFVPVGDTLHHSVEAVGLALLPLFSANVSHTPADVEGENTRLALRSKNNASGRSDATPDRPLRDKHVCFSLPLVSLSVCSAHFDEAALVDPPNVIFQVCVHNINYEHSHNGTNTRILAQIHSITSSIDSRIQDEFVSATAPRGALDVPSQWALYFSKEAKSDAKVEGNTARSDKNNNNSGNDIIYQEDDAVQMPACRVSFIARAHALRLTVSPQLLSTLNECALRHIALGVRGARQTYISWVSSRSAARRAKPTCSCDMSSTEAGDQLLCISSDFCFSADVVLGGDRGSRLHFVKGPINTSPQNRVTVHTINHARIFASMFENADGTTEPPIVVDPGLTVVFENVPIFLERGKLADYALLGSRAVLIAPDAHVTVSSSKSALPSLPSLSRALNRSFAARWFKQQVSFDCFADVVLRLSSCHQTLTMTAEASAKYRVEKQCYEGNRGIRDFVDEGGEVALSNVSVVFDGGAITREPTEFVVHVKHNKGDESIPGTTNVRAVVPPTHFTLSIEHIRPMCALATQIRHSLDEFAEARTISFGHGRKTTLQSVSASRTAQKPSLVWSYDGDPAPNVDFGLSAGTLSAIVTNDFHRPEFLIELNSMALRASGSRNLSKFNCSGQVDVRVADYPQAQPARDLIVVAPELALEYVRYGSGGYSFQGAITCADAVLTLPLETVLRMLRCRAVLQSGGPYSFRNSTGVDLLIAAAEPAKHALESCGHVHQRLFPPSAENGIAVRLLPGAVVQTKTLRNDTACFCISAESNAVGLLPNAFSFVDLSTLYRGATCRTPLGVSASGILDGVVRVDKAQRIIDVTTCVSFSNGLAKRDVCIPTGPNDPFIVRPGETRYVTLPALRHTFSITVGPWRSTTRNALVTLEMLVTAFALFPSKGASAAVVKHLPLPTHAYCENNDTLVVPLKLRGKNADDVEAIVRLVLTRRLAMETTRRCPRLLPKYEVQMRICPLLSIANETGALLAISVGDSAECLLPYGEGDQDWLAPLSAGATVSIALVIGENGLRFAAAAPLPMDFAGSSVSLALCGVTDGALVVERTAHSRLVVRAAAVLHNALPFAVCVSNAKGHLLTVQPEDGVPPGSHLPILHDRRNPTATLRVRAVGSDVKFSMPFTCEAPALSGMLVSTSEVAARFFQVRRGAGKSVAAVPEAWLEPIWLFRNCTSRFSLEVRAVSSQTDAAHMQSITVSRNDVHSRGCCDGDGVCVIHAMEEMEWTNFAASTEENPCVQVRFFVDESVFEWSDPICLSSLSSQNVPVVMKHFMRTTESDYYAKPGVAEFSCIRVPLHLKTNPTSEFFACLSVTPLRHGGQFVVDFALDASVPLVLENRTSRTLQYQEMSQKRPMWGTRDGALAAYIVKPFTDCATCFDGCNPDPVLELVLLDERMNAERCVVDLAKSASTREAIRVGKGVYVLCTYTYSLQRYYVSVTTDRLLESSLVFQPQYIMHFEAFLRSLTMHVASFCVPKKETSLHNTPLEKLALRHQLQLGNLIDSDSTDAEILSALQSKELDVVVFHAIGLCGEFSLNEKHYLGSIGVGRIAVVDCTSPQPLYPVVLEMQKSSNENGMDESPCLSLKFHALASRDDMTPDVFRCAGTRAVTIPFESISLNIIPMTVKLSDSFLFVLLQSYECVLETTQEYKDVGSSERVDDAADDTVFSSHTSGKSYGLAVKPLKSKEDREEYQHEPHDQSECNEATKKRKFITIADGYHVRSTQHSSPVRDAVFYNCRIARLFVSQVELVLTLTRRADGRYDPFSGMLLGSPLIPSVEDAPLCIAETKRYDVNQISSSPFGALTSVLYSPYRNQLLRQLYKIVGSMEFLGNPIALMSGLRQGMRSFLVETVDMNPLKGAQDLFLATASSTLHSVGLLSRVGGRTAAAISLDGAWLEDRDAAPAAGVLRGVARGLRGGIEGAVSRPLDGARAAGIAGFCTGVATGAAGLVMRPVAGALDGFGNTAEFLARLMREQDDVPNPQFKYMNSGRNFVTTEGEKLPSTRDNEVDANAFTTAVQAAETVKERQVESGRDCGEVFVSKEVYNQVQAQALEKDLEGSEAVQFILKAIGPHNYALHAQWSEFVEYSTPEEFHNGLFIALTAAMSVRLKEITTLDSTAATVLESAASSQKGKTIEHNAVERAWNIKNTLGVKGMHSYVSFEHFAFVCSLDEIKSNILPVDLHRKLPRHLLAGMKASLEWIAL